eukprot:GFUD01120401.1.p1 GENE.GFUD01120401.1~~GFUD01120401.1.p1  ORF type:complete len:464 (-),score=144.12 GFUD01120401.1:120-1511(-)
MENSKALRSGDDRIKTKMNQQENSTNDEDLEQIEEVPPSREHRESLPGAIARFSYHARRKQPMDHNKRVCNEYLQDLQNFVTSRVGNKVRLNIPSLEENNLNKSNTKLLEELTKQGWYTEDWNTSKLSLTQIRSAVQSMAVMHAAGLAYRMSMKTNFEKHYPWLMEDLYTSNMAKELIAKHLDSYLHCLSFLSGVGKAVSKLRKIEPDLFQYLVSLRRSNDALGTRFSTICHGDLWQGNLMFKENEGVTQCVMMDFHSSAFLSPASDLAHLILTSCPRELVRDHWESIVEQYYNVFNTTLAQFGLILKHLGTSYNHFRQEVRRAMAGQFLVVCLVVPIVALFGPQEFLKTRDTRRRSSSSDRQNTVRHLIQMMAITEEMDDSSEDDSENDKENIPPEWETIIGNENLSKYTKDLLLTAADLEILDLIRPENRLRSGSWDKTKQTTAKYKPIYKEKIPFLGTVV